MYRGHTFDRRTFLAASASLTAIPLVALPEQPALFVLDRRFAALGPGSAQRVTTFIDGDVTALWRDHLNALWRTGTASVAGITAPSALFCLEQLARGMGRKVSMRLPISGSSAVRWVISPVSSRGFS